jgi:hypothetical protein
MSNIAIVELHNAEGTTPARSLSPAVLPPQLRPGYRLVGLAVAIVVLSVAIAETVAELRIACGRPVPGLVDCAHIESGQGAAECALELAVAELAERRRGAR